MIIAASVSPLADRVIKSRAVGAGGGDRTGPHRAAGLRGARCPGSWARNPACGHVCRPACRVPLNVPRYVAEIEQWIEALLSANVDTSVLGAAQGIAGRLLADFLSGVARARQPEQRGSW